MYIWFAVDEQATAPGIPPPRAFFAIVSHSTRFLLGGLLSLRAEDGGDDASGSESSSTVGDAGVVGLAIFRPDRVVTILFTGCAQRRTTATLLQNCFFVAKSSKSRYWRR
jgi:hypothetical protein